MIKWPLSLLLFLFLIPIARSQNIKKEYAHLFEFGRFQELKEKIQDDYSVDGYFLKGFIAKEEGDIDFAWFNWQKSNTLRIKKYGNNSYWKIWNYVLISNYHYEKINVSSAYQYADSALSLFEKLSEKEKLEINGHQILLLLGQSVKSHAFSTTDLAETHRIYRRAFALYEEAEGLIHKHNLGGYYLAQKHHLTGNCLTDLTFHYSRVIRDSAKAKVHLAEAERNYIKAEEVLRKEFGPKHHRLGKCYFVHGLVWQYQTLLLESRDIQKAKKYYLKSLAAYDLPNKNPSTIIDKSGALMTIRYLNEILLFESKKDKNLTEEELKYLNFYLEIGTSLWHSLQKNYQSKNKNLNLAIYELNPYRDVLKLEVEREKLRKKGDIKVIHQAGHYLKYTDVNNLQLKNKFISIQDVQKELQQDEELLNYFVVNSTDILLIRYNNTKVDYFLIPDQNELIDQLLMSIDNFDFKNYVTTAEKLHKSLIPKTDKKHLIISADGYLNSVPFEALLFSKKGIQKKDYRRLDYLINRHSVRYVLSPTLLKGNSVPIKNDFTIGIPVLPDTLAQLPFSSKHGESICEEFGGKFLEDGTLTKGIFSSSHSNILQINSHGYFKEKQFRLLFSDGEMTVDQLKENGNYPKLVILNTCLSSRGEYLSGEGHNSFVRALKMHGVKALITTRWEVDDKRSNELLVSFYEHFFNGNPSPDALNMAMRTAITTSESSQLAAPYYWASHMHYGRTLMIEKPTVSLSWGWIFWGIIFCTTLVYFWFYLKRKKATF